MESKNCLISGITGQDGSYLAELLLGKGYEIWGIVRRLSQPNLHNIQHLIDEDSITLIGGDLTDQSSIINAIKESKPDEIYHLAAQSFVAASFDQAEMTINTTGLGTLRMIEAVRQLDKDIKFYQAGSSEQFGNAESPQNENTIMIPRSPYAVAKIMAHDICKVYRSSYDMNIWCGICFNHSSPRRGIEFVSRKISDGVARIKLGISRQLKLGNIRSKRDWGLASDYVEAMYLMLQQDEPDDYVIATGESHSVREFVEIAFDYAGLGNWEQYVKFDKSLMRPADIYDLVGDYSKAKRILGWKPKTNFKQLVQIMVDNDINLLK